MANFQYIALNAKGEQTTGVVQANSDAEAAQLLRGQGLYPTQVVEEGKGKLAGSTGKKKAKKGKGGKGDKGDKGGAVPPAEDRAPVKIYLEFKRYIFDTDKAMVQ